MIAEATMIAEAMMVAEVTNEQPVVEPNISPEIKAPETEQKNASGAKKSRSSRRKRMELRRLNPGGNPAGDFSNSSDQGSSSKKKRSEIRIEEPTAAAVEEEPPLTGCTKYGSIAHLGRRREMEDAVASEVEFSTRGGRSYDFYGVYDGHGGRQVAQECEEKMHAILAKAMAAEECGGEIGWEEALTTAFKDMDVEVNRPGSDVNTTGSTAVVAVVGQQELVVANCGDSRAVLCRGGVAVPLSDDHKPDRADELERIETLGGKVINWNGARVLGVLATSRSIGDEYLKPFVITDPDVKVINRTNADEFLILASDGLWDVISNDLACHVTRRCLDGRMRRSVLFTRLMNNEKNLQFDYKMNNKRCMEAAALLAEVALARGSCDNVSVVVVDVSGW